MIHMLIHYKAWANRLTFDALAPLPDAEIEKIRPTNFKTILHTLNHVYVVDDIFKAHLEGKTHSYAARNTETPKPLKELRQSTLQMDQWYLDYSAALVESDLERRVEFEFVGGGKGRMKVQEILMHIVNHGTYHRGFVSDMMYQIPAQVPANDLTIFLRDIWNQ